MTARLENGPVAETIIRVVAEENVDLLIICLLYTSDAADDLLCVDLGGRRIIKKKNSQPPDRPPL